MKSTLLFLYAETPLHAGSGVGLGAVDLPIQRERMSGLPMIQGSGIKGALRERMRPFRAGERQGFLSTEEGRLNDQEFLALFGPWAPKRKGPDEDEERQDATDQPKPDEFAGALSLMDARALLFPVRTAFGGFAWLTCPLILHRLRRDLMLLGITAPEGIDTFSADETQALITAGSVVSRGNRLIIEDMDYKAGHDSRVDTLASWLADEAFPEGKEYEPFRERVKKQLVVVNDTELIFLSKHATEVVARTRIDETTGTVSDGALWTEESLPAETVMWTMATFADSRRPGHKDKSDELGKQFVAKVEKLSRVYLGGDRSVGRGMVGLRLVPGGAK
jgi:CRISPR-associated protein Cmr4